MLTEVPGKVPEGRPEHETRILLKLRLQKQLRGRQIGLQGGWTTLKMTPKHGRKHGREGCGFGSRVSVGLLSGSWGGNSRTLESKLLFPALRCRLWSGSPGPPEPPLPLFRVIPSITADMEIRTTDGSLDLPDVIIHEPKFLSSWMKDKASDSSPDVDAFDFRRGSVIAPPSPQPITWQTLMEWLTAEASASSSSPREQLNKRTTISKLTHLRSGYWWIRRTWSPIAASPDGRENRPSSGLFPLPPDEETQQMMKNSRSSWDGDFKPFGLTLLTFALTHTHSKQTWFFTAAQVQRKACVCVCVFISWWRSDRFKPVIHFSNN